VALITGASGDIGRAIAIRLAESGARVAIGYHRSRDKAEETLKQCQERGGEGMLIPISFEERARVEAAYRQVFLALGTPTIVVHAAGEASVGFFQDFTDEDYDAMMNVHVRGAYYLMQTALPKMIAAQRGRMIVISSIWGETGGAMEVLYSAAKGAQIAMVKALAKEVARSGITVNAVSPGAILTRMLKNQLSPEEQESLAEEIPMGRLGTPEEVAAAVEHLCRDESAYITGQVIRINGGWHC